jgi:hypothetical protein
LKPAWANSSLGPYLEKKKKNPSEKKKKRKTCFALLICAYRENAAAVLRLLFISSGKVIPVGLPFAHNAN